MIAYLSGKITYKTPTYIYVECSGVGYHVNISLHTYSKLEHLDSVKIHTYMHVNDDGQTLYGFYDDDEREMFTLLISVSGIGPNTARMVLSYMTVPEVRSAILTDNAAALNKVKGVGPKTAKRIIIDLKDKVAKIQGEQEVIPIIADNTLKDEALSALVSLGFPKSTIETQLKKIAKSSNNFDNVEDLIKEVLRQLR